MGSTLSVLRQLLEDQLAVGTTSTATDPTLTLLNSYINTSIRKIARQDKPRELEIATPTQADITINTNVVAVPTSFIVPELVYYSDSGGSIKRIIRKDLKEILEINSGKAFFDTAVTGDPNYYTVRGTSLLFDKHFSRTETNAINIYGIGVPSTLVDGTDTTELPIDYDMLITYEAAILFYQRDDDTENQNKFTNVAAQERASIVLHLDTNDEDHIRLDPDTFAGNGTGLDYRNPSVIFTS